MNRRGTLIVILVAAVTIAIVTRVPIVLECGWMGLLPGYEWVWLTGGCS